MHPPLAHVYTQTVRSIHTHSFCTMSLTLTPAAMPPPPPPSPPPLLQLQYPVLPPPAPRFVPSTRTCSFLIYDTHNIAFITNLPNNKFQQRQRHSHPNVHLPSQALQQQQQHVVDYSYGLGGRTDMGVKRGIFGKMFGLIPGSVD